MKIVLAIFLAIPVLAQAPLPSPVPIGGSGGGGGGAASYVGLVATRGQLPNSTVGTGVTWIMSRNIHYARQSIPANSALPIWGNYYVNGSNVETGTGSAVYKAAVEYPAGTVAGLCTINGSTNPTVASVLDAVAGACPHAAIPNGAAFWVRSLVTNAGGIVFIGQTGAFSSNNAYDGAVYGSGTPTDSVLSGSIAADTGVNYMPLAIVASTTQPSVCLVGDSRITGQGDAVNNPSQDLGELARTIGPVYAYNSLAVSGTSASSAVSNFTARLRIIAYCSHVVDEYGINDIGAGRTAAQLAANRTTLAGMFNLPTFGTTIPTSTTSTDSWATTTNQTGTQNPSVVITFNGLERAGISGEINTFDIANAVDPLALGKWPVSKIIGATSGTANFATADGIHESTTMNTIIQQSGAVNTSWIQRR